MKHFIKFQTCFEAFSTPKFSEKLRTKTKIQSDISKCMQIGINLLGNTY